MAGVRFRDYARTQRCPSVTRCHGRGALNGDHSVAARFVCYSPGRLTMPAESVARAGSRRNLGRYLQFLAIVQSTLYAAATLNSDPPLFYLDPRIALYFVHSIAAPGHQVFPTWISWVTAVGLFALGSGVVTSRRWLGVYILIEGVLALAFLAFAAVIVAANTSPSHGFSMGELLLPIFAFIGFSAGPLIVALPLWRADD